jgi:phage shock protein PspC (stress-responsive transcriptional regulator)
MYLELGDFDVTVIWSAFTALVTCHIIAYIIAILQIIMNELEGSAALHKCGRGTRTKTVLL